MTSPAADLDDDAFIAAWLDLSLPFAQWTHRAHVRMAWILLRRHGFAEALPRARAGIRAYNAANHVPEGPQMGYHETVTHAWLRVVDSTMRSQPPADDSRAFCEAQPHLLQRTLLRLFYTRDRIISAEAKGRFVEPDLAPLPR
jgi:hypothetical protein